MNQTGLSPAGSLAPLPQPHNNLLDATLFSASQEIRNEIAGAYACPDNVVVVLNRHGELRH